MDERAVRLCLPPSMETDFGFGFMEGLFLGILIKTGTDASETGITISILNALRSLISENLLWLIPTITLILTIGGAIVTYERFKENKIEVGLGFVFGLGITLF